MLEDMNLVIRFSDMRNGYEGNIWHATKSGTSKKGGSQYSNTSWYGLYRNGENYAKSNDNLGVNSEMIWGSQWDQMMIFVNGKDDGAEIPAKFYVTKAASRGSSSISTKTGMNPLDQVANIFDLEASRYEATQALGSSNGDRIIRSGYWDSGKAACAITTGSLPDGASGVLRMTLYLS